MHLVWLAKGLVPVSPRFLIGVFDSVYLAALCAWVGSVLFFSFVVAPVVFTVLDKENGGKFVRALLPRYYAWGAFAGAIALPAFVARPLCYPEFRGPSVAVQSLLILTGTLIMLYAGNSLSPAMVAARDAGSSETDRLERLRRLSAGLNTLVLLIGAGLLIAFANREAPQSAGLQELNPSEQGRFDDELNAVIEDVETRYGLRPERPGRKGQVRPPGRHVDPEMIQELESYYRQKQLRDQSRKGPSQGESRGAAGQSPPLEGSAGAVSGVPKGR